MFTCFEGIMATGQIVMCCLSSTSFGMAIRERLYKTDTEKNISKDTREPISSAHHSGIGEIHHCHKKHKKHKAKFEQEKVLNKLVGEHKAQYSEVSMAEEPPLKIVVEQVPASGDVSDSDA